jgi:hypothetical protein
MMATGHLLLVVALSIGNNTPLIGCLLLDGLHEIICLLLHLHRINGLLVKHVLSLFLHVCHLVFQVDLHFLVLSKFDHFVILGLKAMQTVVFVDHVSPETVLLSLNRHNILVITLEK